MTPAGRKPSLRAVAIAASTLSGSILNVSSRTSTKTGVAWTSATTSAVAAKVNVGQNTASPAPTPFAIRPSRSASVPFAQVSACRTPQNSASRRSNSATSPPMMKFACSQTRKMASSIRAPNRRRCACRSTRGIGLAFSRMAAKRSCMRHLLQGVLRRQEIALTGSRAGEVIAESLARMTDPADAARRNTGHQRKRSYIAGDDGARSDEAVHAEAGAAQDSGIRPDRDATLDHGLKKFIVVIDLGARDLNVGEHAAGTAKYAVLQFDPFVDATLFLILQAVAVR